MAASGDIVKSIKKKKKIEWRQNIKRGGMRGVVHSRTMSHKRDAHASRGVGKSLRA